MTANVIFCLTVFFCVSRFSNGFYDVYIMLSLLLVSITVYYVYALSVQGNPRPGTMLSERDVHSSFHCSQPFCSPFRCSWWFGRILRTRLQLGNRAFFVWVARSCGTVYHWKFVRHLHYQRSKACSRHVFSRSYFTD